MCEKNEDRCDGIKTMLTHLGEFTGLLPLLGLLPRGGSFTKFRQDANLFSRACKKTKNIHCLEMK